MKRQTCKRKSAPKQWKATPAPLRINTARTVCDFSFPVAHFEKERNRFSQSSLESAENQDRNRLRRTLSVTFSISVLSSFRVWGKMTEEWNTTFHLRSCLGRIKPPESITFATAVNGKWAKLLTLVPIMLTLNALSHWVEDQANRIRQTESQLFLWPLYLPFPTPPPKA